MIDQKYCLNCGSLLGLDCGDAEPDYNEDYCSEGCCKMETKQIINYAEFLNNNLEQLKINYKTSYEFIYESTLTEFCRYVYKGLEIGAWLPVEYTYKITK